MRRAGLSPRTRLTMMFGSVGIGVVHGTWQIMSAAGAAEEEARRDEERHLERRRRGIE
jgi:hypothetical protein